MAIETMREDADEAVTLRHHVTELEAAALTQEDREALLMQQQKRMLQLGEEYERQHVDDMSVLRGRNMFLVTMLRRSEALWQKISTHVRNVCALRHCGERHHKIISCASHITWTLPS